MSKINWQAMIDDIVDDALYSYFQNQENFTLLNLLADVGTEGLSFSEIQKRTEFSPGVLQRRLENLSQSGFIDNFLEKREGSRDYSHYRLTLVGKITFNEVENAMSALKIKIKAKLILSSNGQVIQELGNDVYGKINIHGRALHTTLGIWEKEVQGVVPRVLDLKNLLYVAPKWNRKGDHLLRLYSEGVTNNV